MATRRGENVSKDYAFIPCVGSVWSFDPNINPTLFRGTGKSTCGCTMNSHFVLVIHADNARVEVLTSNGLNGWMVVSWFQYYRSAEVC